MTEPRSTFHQQSMARDMRALVRAARVTFDFDRSADLMVNVAKVTERLLGSEIPRRLRGLLQAMSTEGVGLYRLAMDSHAEGDADLAAAEGEVGRALARERGRTLAETRLAGALAVIPQGVVVFDGDGSNVFRNKVAAAYRAARHGEALADEAIDQLTDEIVAIGGVAAPSRTADLLGPPRRTLVPMAVESGERACEVGALVVIDDVTARRRLEAVRRDFVANISHELKTPGSAGGVPRGRRVHIHVATPGQIRVHRHDR